MNSYNRAYNITNDSSCTYNYCKFLNRIKLKWGHESKTNTSDYLKFKELPIIKIQEFGNSIEYVKNFFWIKQGHIIFERNTSPVRKIVSLKTFVDETSHKRLIWNVQTRYWKEKTGNFWYLGGYSRVEGSIIIFF